MSEKEQDPTKSSAPAIWPPPPERSQKMYSNFLQSELSKVEQKGGELNRLDLLKRLLAEYPLSLEIAMSVLDEFCSEHVPELRKESKEGNYILSAILLWGIIFVVAVVKGDYYLCILLTLLALLVSIIKMVHRQIRR